MTSALSVVLLGFFLGMRHATDPDHVLAITTIVSRQRSVRAAAWIGVLWGVGHGATILVVGAAVLLLGVVVPPRLGVTMELSVAAMLVGLGAWTLWGALRGIRVAPGAGGGPPAPEAAHHSHPHRHGDYVHTHPHGHDAGAHGHPDDRTPAARLDRRLGRLAPYRALRPVAIGVVHGLAGSAGVALLVLAAIRDPWWGTAYLAVFGLGTIAGMLLVTAAVAVPFAYTAHRVGWLNRHLAAASGVASLAFGLFLAWGVRL